MEKIEIKENISNIGLDLNLNYEDRELIEKIHEDSINKSLYQLSKENEEMQVKFKLEQKLRKIQEQENIKQLRKLISNEIKIEYQKGNIKTGIKEYDKIIKKNNNLKRKKKYIQKGKLYYFITINPIECKINDLKNIIKKINKRKLYNIHSYIYEQRGITNEDMGKGKHIHLILEKTKSKSIIIKELSNTLKKYCEKEKIDIKEITENGKAIRERYMLGEKQILKLPTVEIDKIWRKENKLKEIYIIIKSKNIEEDENYRKEEKLFEEEVNKENKYIYYACLMIKENGEEYYKIKINNEEILCKKIV